MWQDMVDGSEGEHDEAECSVGGVEALGTAGDETHPAVEAFVAGIVHAKGSPHIRRLPRRWKGAGSHFYSAGSG